MKRYKYYIYYIMFFVDISQEKSKDMKLNMILPVFILVNNN